MRGTCSETADPTGTSDTITSTGWTETGSFAITPAGWRTWASSCSLPHRHRQPHSAPLSEDQWAGVGRGLPVLHVFEPGVRD
jgi:hypothetical protein